MSEIVYSTRDSTSNVLIGEPWTMVAHMIDPAKTMIITDDNVYNLYGSEFPDCRVIRISPGEQSKNLANIEKILKEMLGANLDRSGFLLGIGGGVVCDITGFAASVYMRGIKFGFVSTTLLSQVDASIGGKNGVNLDGVKNIAGSFTQPDFVVCDPSMLKTLTDEDFRSGLAEMLKHGVIRDRELFDRIAGNKELIDARDENFLKEVVEWSVKIKKSIVEKDEKEEGERRLLNFGHTVGHAIEAVTGIEHGLAVAVGMDISAMYSVKDGKLSENEYHELNSALQALGLPVKSRTGIDDLINHIRQDKKREGDDIHFIGLSSIGNAYVEPIPFTRLISGLKEIMP